MKKSYFIILILLIALSLTGCGSKKGELYKKRVVLKRVARVVPSENYKLDRIEPVQDSDVSKEIYYFKSKDRDLEFRAINTRQPVLYESGLYGKALKVLYAEDVHELYKDRIEGELMLGGYDFKHHRFCINSFNELKKVSDTIVAADNIYKQETKYNTPEWMVENPAHKCTVSLMHINENGKEVGSSIGGAHIDGTWDSKKLYDYLCYRYASCIKKGDFSDDSVPRSVLDMAHIQTLKHVYLNGIEISKTGYDDAKSEGVYNNSESSYCAEYCYAMNDYIIEFNTAIVPKDCGPHVTEEYLSILAPGYDVKYNDGLYKWDYNGSEYVATTTPGKKSDYVGSFSITKDGQNLELPYIKCSEWTSPVHGLYVVGLTVHDFAKLFNLSVEIDEDSESLYFSENY